KIAPGPDDLPPGRARPGRFRPRSPGRQDDHYVYESPERLAVCDGQAGEQTGRSGRSCLGTPRLMSGQDPQIFELDPDQAPRMTAIILLICGLLGVGFL